ncbi:MAG: YfhO family protein [Deltaproteobacteria bacterium]|nr:YfhO family protein [Deltaproteobacteria bacterium]
MTFIFFSLSSPLWTTFLFDRGKIIPLVRAENGATKGLFLSVADIAKAQDTWNSATKPYDLLSLISPLHHYTHFRNIQVGLFEKSQTESFLYIGILPFALAVYAIFCARHKYKANFLILLISICLLMLGTKFIFYTVFLYIFPALRFARHPMQFVPFFIFFLLYFSGLGIDSLIDTYEKLKFRLRARTVGLIFMSNKLVVWIMYFFAISLSMTFSDLGTSSVNARYVYFFSACLVFFLLTFVIYYIWPAVIENYMKLLTILVVLSNLFVFNSFYRPLVKAERDIAFSTKAVMPQISANRSWELKEDIPIAQYQSLLFRKPAARKGILKHKDISHKEAGTHWGIPPFFALANFFTMMSLPEDKMSNSFGITDPILNFYRNALPYTDEYFERYFVNPFGTESVLLLSNNSGMLKDELLYREGAGKSSTDVDFFSYEPLSYTPNNINLKVHTRHKGFLYFSDGYDENWKAYIDSKETDIFRANVNFKAILLPAGVHTVRFVYNPICHKISLWAYFITLLSISFYVCGYLIIHKRPVHVSWYFKKN